jgi:pyruvate/2-oxoglutarate dehydrogenase complex dihydrolipoamide acyltransferase (E2) component
MASAVVMPKAGITVESCYIGEWAKKVGDHVNKGDILFTFETDKAVFECESTAEGELLEIFYTPGDEVKVLTNVCAIGVKGEDTTSLRPGTAPATATPAPQAVKAAAPAQMANAAVPAQSAALSPRARELARRSGTDASLAVPTGPHGRVIERDIRVAMAAVPPAPAEAPAAPAALSPAIQAPAATYTDVRFTVIRRAVASAMKASLAGMAQVTNHSSFDATAILAYRKMLKGMESPALTGITLNDMVLYVVIKTLANHPDLNAHLIGEDTLRRYSSVNIGVAVDTPRGLMVPTLFGAEKLTLAGIAAGVRDLAAMARAGSINPDLLTGGTFTVSNLGTLGVESFTPVINPPQTAILGVCAITTRVRDAGGTAVPYPAMGLSLTYDHRAVDGAPAARFAKELAASLENFTTLLAL